MKNTRLVCKDEANIVSKPGVVILEYFKQIIPNLGLATATINGTYPPENEGIWSINEQVDEMYYVLRGEGTMIYEDGRAITLKQNSAAYIPRGLKFRVESARDLEVVVPTGPAWSEGQHKYIKPPHFATKSLPNARDDVAPDGSDVRILLGLSGGGMAHFKLGPNQTSKAVTHRTIEEIWFFLSGRGEMWRKQEGHEEIVSVGSCVCITIPLGTHFQFRSIGDEPLEAIGLTMPPWPGEGEAIVVKGKWEPTVPDK